jgi:uncharacterized membrane protein YgcG
MAIRSARATSVDCDDLDLDERVGGHREIDDRLAGGERVERSVEALKALKPDEARALLLKAEGLSYDEIGTRFGWSYTKVNRSIAEGRKRFLKVYRGIESGEACEAWLPVLDALAGGTATSAQLMSIRPHLRHCSACRATVRSMRFSRTRRIALLAPFGWLTRVLSRSDVMQYASTGGGGRLGPAAAALGLCLGSVGAGACVVTGALPAPPIIAKLETNAAAPKPVKATVTKKTVTTKKKPAATRTPTPTPPVTYAAATSTPAPTATATKKTTKAKTARKHTTVKKKRKRASATVSEFGSFEGQAASAPTQKSTAVASAASSGSGTGSSSSSGGSSSGGGSGTKAAGSEFGIEGG